MGGRIGRDHGPFSRDSGRVNPPIRLFDGELFGARERHSKILVIDDDASNRNLLLTIMRRSGFTRVMGVATGLEGITAFSEFEPDLTLLDLHLPDMDGREVLAEMKLRTPPEAYIPILVLTGDISVEARDDALSAGARDFLVKPYEAAEVLLRINNLLETRVLHLELQRQNALLMARFEERSRELEDARIEILDRLARACEMREQGTFGHGQRVAALAADIAIALGWSAESVDQLKKAAALHDIGKIGVDDSILLKPGPLVPSEFEAQSQHTILGAAILSGSHYPALRMAEEVALTHHERWDGCGYPAGLAGADIPMCGRIVAVADAFDALTHQRPYKRAWTPEDAVTQIQRDAGTRYDPAVVEAFIRIVEQRTAQSAGSMEPSAHMRLRTA